MWLNLSYWSDRDRLQGKSW